MKREGKKKITIEYFVLRTLLFANSNDDLHVHKEWDEWKYAFVMLLQRTIVSI